MSEKAVHQAVTNYLKLQYPKVLFRSDSGAGMKLTIGQAKAQKAIQNGMAWPDLFIAEARGGYKGLFIELKDESVILTKKNGEMKSDHLLKQYQCIQRLKDAGYSAFFSSGFDNTKQSIDQYMSWDLTK